MSSSRRSLVRASAPTPVTTARVPPPNMTGVATRSLSWATWLAAPSSDPRSSQRSSGPPVSVGERRGEPVDGAGGRQLIVAPEPGQWRGRHAPRRATRRASPVQARRRTSAGAMPAARQTSCSRRMARSRTRLPSRVVPADRSARRRFRPGTAAATRRTGHPSTPGAGRPACRHRPRSAPPASRTRPSGDSLAIHEPRDRVSGDRARQFRVAVPGQPGRGSVAMRQRAGRVGRPEGPCPCRAAAPPTPRAVDRARSRPPPCAPRGMRRPPRRRARAARTRAGDRGRAGGRRPPRAGAPSSGRMVPDGRRPGSARFPSADAEAVRPAGRLVGGGCASGCRSTSAVTGIAQRNAGAATPWPSGATTDRDRLGRVRAARGSLTRWLPPRGPRCLGGRERSRSPSRPGPCDIRRRRPPADRSSGLAGRMPVRVPGAGRGDRDPRPDRVHERLCRCRSAAVMGDLEQVEPRKPWREQPRIDALFDVAGEQEAVPADRPEQHDRDVVDARSRRRAVRAGHSPASGHRTVIAISSTVRRSPAARPRALGSAGAGKSLQPRRIAGSGAAHPGLEDAGGRDTARGAGRGRPRDPRAGATGRWHRCADPTVAADDRGRPAGGSASGPPSTRTRPPPEPSTRIASPWPTSRTVIRATPGRSCGDDGSGHEDRDGEPDCGRSRPAPGRPRPGRARGSVLATGGSASSGDWLPAAARPFVLNRRWSPTMSPRRDGRGQHIKGRVERDAGERQCAHSTGRSRQRSAAAPRPGAARTAPTCPRCARDDE